MWRFYESWVLTIMLLTLRGGVNVYRLCPPWVSMTFLLRVAGGRGGA